MHNEEFLLMSYQASVLCPPYMCVFMSFLHLQNFNWMTLFSIWSTPLTWDSPFSSMPMIQGFFSQYCKYSVCSFLIFLNNWFGLILYLSSTPDIQSFDWPILLVRLFSGFSVCVFSYSSPSVHLALWSVFLFFYSFLKFWIILAILICLMFFFVVVVVSHHSDSLNSFPLSSLRFWFMSSLKALRPLVIIMIFFLILCPGVNLVNTQ